MLTAQADIPTGNITEHLLFRPGVPGPDEKMIVQYLRDVECGKALRTGVRMNG